MAQTRSVALLTARETIEIARRPLVEPGAGEVLIRIKAVGVCGSDVAYFRTGRTGVGEVAFPHILGHECAGVVQAVGPDVESVRLGDRVTTEPGCFCGLCAACTSGRYNLCRQMSFMGSAAAGVYGEGALVEYAIRPAHLVYRLPESASFAGGAMLEPLSVGLHAARRAQIQAGARAAILGCGPIAGCLLLVLKAMGVDEVTMTDVLPDRLARMHALGAHTLNADGLDEKALAAALPEGEMDVVFDTTCAAPALNASLRWLKKGGTLVQVGVPGGKLSLDMQTLFNRGVTLVPSFRYANAYPALISMMAAGRLPVEALITHRFPFAQTQAAFELAASRAPGVMKVMIEFP